MTTTADSIDIALGAERSDLLETLTVHRGFLRRAVNGLTDDQARLRPTASELCLGGIVKHVTTAESGWVDFILEGPGFKAGADESAYEAHAASFRMEANDTLADLLTAYDQVARRTDELLTTLPSLDLSHPLPEAPWFEPGGTRSARRVFLHIVAETAQHAGHADIIRETIDGSKTMG
jgi:uncharacterized damage-inducible protein DinB